MNLSELSEEDYFAHLKEMFKSPGWQIFIKEMDDLAYVTNNIQDVTSEKDLWIRRGTLDNIGRTLNYEDTILRAEREVEQDEGPE